MKKWLKGREPASQVKDLSLNPTAELSGRTLTLAGPAWGQTPVPQTTKPELNYEANSFVLAD